jgi:hypothetical protein
VGLRAAGLGSVKGVILGREKGVALGCDLTFSGSGSLIAAEKTGRRGHGIEIDPHYVDTIIRRFEAVYGLKAVHAESRLDFAGARGRRSEERKDDPQTKENAINATQRRRIRGRPR